MRSFFISCVVGVGCMESHPREHYCQIFQEVMHKQCFGRIQRGHCVKDDVEYKGDNDWVESTNNDSVMSGDSKSDE
jgi:hypothetical protein